MNQRKLHLRRRVLLGMPIGLLVTGSAIVAAMLFADPQAEALLSLQSPIPITNEPVLAVAAQDEGPVKDAQPDVDRITRIVVLSDMNGSYGSTHYHPAVRAAIETTIALKPDLVLSTGDMVAGQRSGLDYRGMWRSFHNTVTEPLEEAGIPFAVTPGNHDASGYAIHSTERRTYVRQWNRHRPDLDFIDDSEYPLRYTFSMGSTFFVSLDDTMLGPLSSDDMEWLERQLQIGEAFPHQIVYGHVPLYPFAEGRRDDSINDPALEQMLNTYGVDAFISGHHHAYYPGHRGDLRLVSTSCLGSGPRALLGTEEVSARSILLIEIDRDTGITTLEALSGGEFDEEVPRYTLPTMVGEGATAILRDDVDRAVPIYGPSQLGQ